MRLYVTYRLYAIGCGNGPKSETAGPEGAPCRAGRSHSRRAVHAARRLFVAKGYHGTGTEEVVAEANAGTRGALYHHFADKRALFEAVFIAVEEDLVTEAAKNVADPADGALNRLRQGLIGFLNASLTPQVQRILLITDQPYWAGCDGANLRACMA